MSLMVHFEAVAKYSPKKRRSLPRTYALSISSFPIEIEKVNFQPNKMLSNVLFRAQWLLYVPPAPMLIPQSAHTVH
jgi:hypothetical protein